MAKTSHYELSELALPGGRRARVLKLYETADYTTVLAHLGFSRPQSTLVIIGGASYLSDACHRRLKSLFIDGLAPVAQAQHLTVIDGGTDAGVIRLMGQARRAIQGSFPLLGVAPLGKIQDLNPQESVDSVALKDLEPNHTHFCLIPGENWGAESAWLAGLAATLSCQRRSVTVLANGGSVALMDLQANLQQGSPAIVIAGSGRLADQVAAAIADPLYAVDPLVRSLVTTFYPHQLFVFELGSPLNILQALLRQHLTHHG